MKSNGMIEIFKSFSFGLLINLILVFHAFAFGVETHQAINSQIADENSTVYGSYLHNYLKNNLGMQDGVKTLFDSKMAKEWISDGGAYEDAGLRSLNHFHNPLKDKGILGQDSALVWATLPVGSQSNITTFFSGNYSWYDVRSYYYQALTAADKSTREDNFAKTFRGLGQVMHLVQDMSVPAHVRRDLHPPPFWNDSYEIWAGKNISSANQASGYSAFYYMPYDESFLIKKLFDTDQYNGTNPSITISNSIGLAEFTNANFMNQKIGIPYLEVKS